MNLSHVADQLLIEFATKVTIHVAGNVVYSAASMTSEPRFFAHSRMKSLSDFESASDGFSPTTEVLCTLEYSNPLRVVVLSTTLDGIRVTPVRLAVASDCIRVEENVRPLTWIPTRSSRSLVPSDNYEMKGRMVTSLPFNNPLNVKYDSVLFRSLEEAALVAAG